MRIALYVDNGVYVDTIDVENDASNSDILETVTQVVLEWAENSLYWELEED